MNGTEGEDIVTVEDVDDEVNRSLTNAAPSGELVCEPINNSAKEASILLDRNIREKSTQDLSGLHDEEPTTSFSEPASHPRVPVPESGPQFSLEDIMRALGVNAAQQQQRQQSQFGQPKMAPAQNPSYYGMPRAPVDYSSGFPPQAENDLPVQIGVTPDGRPVFVRPVGGQGVGSQPRGQDWQSQLASELRRLQEEDENQQNTTTSAAPISEKQSWIAIDLGSSTSRVATVDHDTVHVLTDDEGNRSSASCLVFDSQSAEVYVADAAQHSLSLAFPQSTVYDFLSLLHKPISHPWVQANMPYWPFRVVADVHGECAVQLLYRGQWRVFSIEDLLALQLNSLRLEADRALHRQGESAKHVVISTSCDLSSSDRETLVKAAHRAGFEKVRCAFNASAALSNVDWGIRHIHANTSEAEGVNESLTLVVDCGADRVHVAIAKACEGMIETQLVRTQQWTTSLTHAMMGEIINELRINAKVDLLQPGTGEKEVERLRVLLALRQQCENAKHLLSLKAELEAEEPTANIELRDVEEHPILTARITLTQFNELCAPFVEQTISFVRNTLEAYFSANGSTHPIDEIVLLGGHSHIPAVEVALSTALSTYCPSFFNSLTLDVSDGVHRAEGVVSGCAAHAAVLAGLHDLDKLSLDALASIEVSNFSLSLHIGDLHDGRRTELNGEIGAAADDRLEIVPAGTRLPVRKTKLISLPASTESMRLISLSLYEEDKSVFRCMVKLPTDTTYSAENAERVLRAIVDIDSDYAISLRLQDLLTQSVIFEKENISFSPLVHKSVQPPITANVADHPHQQRSEIEPHLSKSSGPTSQDTNQQDQAKAFEQAIREAILREQQMEQQKRKNLEKPAFPRARTAAQQQQQKQQQQQQQQQIDRESDAAQYDWWRNAVQQPAQHHALTVPDHNRPSPQWKPNVEAPVFVPASRAIPRELHQAANSKNQVNNSSAIAASTLRQRLLQEQQQQRQEQEQQLWKKQMLKQQQVDAYHQRLNEERKQELEQQAFQEFLRQLVTKRERDEVDHDRPSMQQSRGRPRHVEPQPSQPLFVLQQSQPQYASGPAQLQQKQRAAISDSLYVCLDSALREFELSPQDVHDAWHALKDEAVASPALLKRLSTKSLQTLLERKGVKTGIALAVHALHDDLHRSTQGKVAVASEQHKQGTPHAPEKSQSLESRDHLSERVDALEGSVARLENKIDKLASVLLTRQNLW